MSSLVSVVFCLCVGLITCPESPTECGMSNVSDREAAQGKEWGWRATGKNNDVMGNNRCLFWDPYKTHNKYKVWAQYRISECWTWWYVYLPSHFKPLIHGRLLLCCSPSTRCPSREICSWHLRVPRRLPTENGKWMSNKPLPYSLPTRYTFDHLTKKSTSTYRGIIRSSLNDHLVFI